MIIHWKAVEQYFTMVLFVFRFSPACNFGKFDNFEFGIIRSERVKGGHQNQRLVAVLRVQRTQARVHVPLYNSLVLLLLDYGNGINWGKNNSFLSSLLRPQRLTLGDNNLLICGLLHFCFFIRLNFNFVSNNLSVITKVNVNMTYIFYVR